MDGAPIDVEVVRAENALVAGLGETDGIEDVERHPALARRGGKRVLAEKRGADGFRQ
jgi:hypothetical protein